jgi:hypothetical protein
VPKSRREQSKGSECPYILIDAGVYRNMSTPEKSNRLSKALSLIIVVQAMHPETNKPDRF